MSRSVQIVLLCEDRQQEAFARRFLKKMGWSTRRLRVELAPPGEGSAEQFVRTRYPIELAAHRSKRGSVTQALLVVVDGDERSPRLRVEALDGACQEEGVEPRRSEERVAVFVPTWRIETWLAYLDGDEVDEGRRDYPRLPRERECRRHVDALVEMCREGKLRAPAPASLETACEEFERLRDVIG